MSNPAQDHSMKQNTSHAVMGQRHESNDSLDLFCTPPWSVRAICEELGLAQSDGLTVFDPCCGYGHMAVPLKEYFDTVHSSDIYDYGYGQVGDYIGMGDVAPWFPPEPIDWVFMNPPFNKAAEFVEISRARYPKAGLAVLVRTSWVESINRYHRIFSNEQLRPSAAYISVERIPMAKGKYDPKGSSATSYSWLIWMPNKLAQQTQMKWLPPGGKKKFFRQSDTLIGKASQV